MTVNDNLVPNKNRLVKGTSQDWFDTEIMKKKQEHKQKLFKHFKKILPTCR